MSRDLQKIRVEISTAMTAENPVEVEVEGAELERLSAMTVEDALKFLLAKKSGHLTARHVSQAIQDPFAYVEINGQPAPLRSERMGRFLEPERGTPGSESGQGPVVKTVAIFALRQERGG